MQIVTGGNLNVPKSAKDLYYDLKKGQLLYLPINDTKPIDFQMLEFSVPDFRSASTDDEVIEKDKTRASITLVFHTNKLSAAEKVSKGKSWCSNKPANGGVHVFKVKRNIKNLAHLRGANADGLRNVNIDLLEKYGKVEKSRGLHVQLKGAAYFEFYKGAVKIDNEGEPVGLIFLSDIDGSTLRYVGTYFCVNRQVDIEKIGKAGEDDGEEHKGEANVESKNDAIPPKENDVVPSKENDENDEEEEEEKNNA
jgi:hypothetical protein